MIEDKQALSPAQWKSVSDHLMELSEKVQQATKPSSQISEPRNETTGSKDLRNK
jgi:hypothetical protein